MMKKVLCLQQKSNMAASTPYISWTLFFGLCCCKLQATAPSSLQHMSEPCRAILNLSGKLSDVVKAKQCMPIICRGFTAPRIIPTEQKVATRQATDLKRRCAAVPFCLLSCCPLLRIGTDWPSPCGD